MLNEVPTVTFNSGAQGLGVILAEFGTDAAAILAGEEIQIGRDANGNWQCSTTLTEASGYVPASCSAGGLVAP
jgi:hypothetical protein